MHARNSVWSVGALAVTLACGACSGDESEQAPAASGGGGEGTVEPGGTIDGIPSGEALTISGVIVDFKTRAPVAAGATLTTDGLIPPPTVSVAGAEFDIEGVAPFSVFHLLSGAPPTHRSTYHAGFEVADEDVDGVELEVVSEAFLTELASELGVTPQPGTAIVIARAFEPDGSPASGVPRGAFAVNGEAPPTPAAFLGSSLEPAPAASETVESGYAVFFDVPVGTVTVGALEGSGYTMVSAVAPVAANIVTLIDVEVSLGEYQKPDYASFSHDIVPILQQRGCVACHSGDAPGADLGNLAVNGGENKIHRELTEEISEHFQTTRVNLAEPEASVLLRMPSYESPADHHPNVTFTGPADPDYQMLLKWIELGAPEN
jgi:hypothetical protein